MGRSPHIFTHNSLGLSHTYTHRGQGSELGFYPLSTVFRRGYYYYLYIYKSRFQADRFHIRFPLLTITMNPRATA